MLRIIAIPEVKGVNPEELNQWTNMIERTTKEICGDTLNNIQLGHTHGKEFQLAVKDRKSVLCLTRTIDRYIHSMALILQGIFQTLSTDLKQARFNQSEL
jgi:glycosylphosphatidylinositol transamidase (GPIT) subunit GPI8